jgi:hypothetical protein
MTTIIFLLITYTCWFIIINKKYLLNKIVSTKNQIMNNFIYKQIIKIIKILNKTENWNTLSIEYYKNIFNDTSIMEIITKHFLTNIQHILNNLKENDIKQFQNIIKIIFTDEKISQEQIKNNIENINNKININNISQNNNFKNILLESNNNFLDEIKLFTNIIIQKEIKTNNNFLLSEIQTMIKENNKEFKKEINKEIKKEVKKEVKKEISENNDILMIEIKSTINDTVKHEIKDLIL